MSDSAPAAELMERYRAAVHAKDISTSGCNHKRKEPHAEAGC
jgi:hypothetical protein